MRVMVTGGRHYGSKQSDDGRYLVADHAAQLSLTEELTRFDTARRIEALIVGDASGADLLAYRWANERGVPVERFRADWKKFGRAAGPIRNAVMIRDGRPDLVIAFPGNAGTENAVDTARKAGVEVLDLRG